MRGGRIKKRREEREEGAQEKAIERHRLRF